MLIISELDKPENIKYKRIIYGGETDNPSIKKHLYIGYNKTIEQEIVDGKLYPCLVVFESKEGKKKFIQVDSPDRRSKKFSKK